MATESKITTVRLLPSKKVLEVSLSNTFFIVISFMGLFYIIYIHDCCGKQILLRPSQQGHFSRDNILAASISCCVGGGGKPKLSEDFCLINTNMYPNKTTTKITMIRILFRMVISYL